MKKFKKIIILLAVILAVAIIVFIVLRPKNIASQQKMNQLENLATNEAKAQSYAASKMPSQAKDDRILGAQNASLKIYVYEDNASLYSAQLADTLDKLLSDKPSQLAVIIRPFLTKNSTLTKEAALAVECAGDGKWTAMRALLFAKVKNNSLSFTEFGNYAKEIGLNEKDFAACLTNQEKSAKIEKLSAEAENYNVIGAPTIFIGDEMILGARPYEDYTDSNGDTIEGLKSVIDKKIK